MANMVDPFDNPFNLIELASGGNGAKTTLLA
jgi:hypothetical protein